MNLPVQSVQLTNIYWVSTAGQQPGAGILNSNKTWPLSFGNLESRTLNKDVAAALEEISSSNVSLSPVKSHKFLASWLKRTASKIRGSYSRPGSTSHYEEQYGGSLKN